VIDAARLPHRCHPRGGWLAAIAVALLVPTGCGHGKGTGAAVQGKITFNGKAVPYGVIAFSEAGGRPISAAIQPDGSYAANVPSGQYAVRIDAPPQLPPDWKEGQPLPKMAPRALPEKYGNFTTSGLTATVRDESQQLDFALP
jgi:hypothetical protein